MKPLMPKILLLAALTFSLNNLYSQQCEVEKETLKGTYTGDCKKGKAHGNGKSVGVDTYEGDFKSGLPDGQGTYTWSNKNTFTGKFSKGLREGKGSMLIKKTGAADSLVEGYWKKDVYIGKNEKPWIVYSKTGSVTKVDADFDVDNMNRIKFIVTNTTGGVSSNNNAGQLPQLRIDNVVILKGNYERMTSLEAHYKSTETSLLEVRFPLRVKLQIAREEIEMEFFEAGNYTVNIAINN
jgi:hypothetical protein